MFQRAVIHESVLPLLARGPAGVGILAILAGALLARLDEYQSLNDYFEKVVKDMRVILKCVLTLSGKLQSPEDVEKVMNTRAAGVLLRVAQGINAAPCWSGKYSTFLRLATATHEHGPAVGAAVELLKTEMPELGQCQRWCRSSLVGEIVSQKDCLMFHYAQCHSLCLLPCLVGFERQLRHTSTVQQACVQSVACFSLHARDHVM